MSYEDIAVWSRILGTIVVLAMLWYAFVRFLAPAIARAQETKNAEIREAERRRDAAKAAIAAAEAAVAAAERDAGAIRERAAADGRREREHALEQTREAGERGIRNAEGELARARANAQVALRTEMIEAALALARREAQDEVDAARNAGLADTFMAALEKEERRG